MIVLEVLVVSFSVLNSLCMKLALTSHVIFKNKLFQSLIVNPLTNLHIVIIQKIFGMAASVSAKVEEIVRPDGLAVPNITMGQLDRHPFDNVSEGYRYELLATRVSVFTILS